jgi:hypothetical protein
MIRVNTHPSSPLPPTLFIQPSLPPVYTEN